MFRYVRKYLDTKHSKKCHISFRHLSRNLMMSKKDFHLTDASTSHAVYLNRVMTTLTLLPCQAVPSFTKVCSLLDSFVHSLKIYRMQIMNPLSQWFTPVSVPTQTQAGNVLIRTVLWYITVKSTPSVEMPIRCSPVKKPWLLTI